MALNAYLEKQHADLFEQHYIHEQLYRKLVRTKQIVKSPDAFAMIYQSCLNVRQSSIGHQLSKDIEEHL